MKFDVLTLFPAFFDSFKDFSIIKRALGKGVAEITATDIRSYTKDKYGRTDTPPVGGGAGLVEKAQPIVDAIKDLKGDNGHVILFSPRGKKFDQKEAIRLSKMDHILLVCGHYEGVDERVNAYCDELLSIGDYILTGGEIAALSVMDAVIRLLDGAITKDSLTEESFDENLLEYPQYTEPYEFEGAKVPDILYSGNHEAIAKWRRKQSLLLTKKYRPDLFEKVNLTKTDKKLLKEKEGETPSWEAKALQKGHKFIKT